MRMKRRSGPIPRITLSARHVTETVNAFNEPTGLTKTPFNALLCTIQPFVGDDMLPALEGFSTKDVYTVFTETEIIAGEEGTAIKSDEIQIYNKWYRVVKVKKWQVGVIPHYEVVCILLDTGLI